ncbi:unnamed protein product [Acanthoscelides obtectus]|uniref:Uncharacterized protein n=1 Tax=Acanthoscelides obtectus TaxID=200917 RepID=A0A9P0JJ53_ACAOB|nr:unnamed protein product [Acanthoscelides obtectus]CAK1639888.1 hypothetical protein AOBTE_LOCUS11433 [Acanthoscelides obtectus]
MLSLNWRGI